MAGSDLDPKDLTETYHDFTRQLQPGSSLSSRYEILRLLGVGGMGRVYLARDKDLDIDVALKLIRPELLGDDKSVERFKNELILARKVSHKNVARIHDLGEVDGLKFLTMTYIPGKTLREVIREEGRLPVERAVSIFNQIAEAVSAAHEEGVIHRDLKPANILIDENDRVYVTDFGIARSLGSVDHTGTGVLLGTPAYLSPEQTWGESADLRTDIYALGLMLCEMLTGQLPFDQTTAHSFRTKLPPDLDTKIRKLQPQIPAYVIGILKKCLNPNRALRYQTINAIRDDLNSKEVRIPWRPSVSLKYVAVIVLILGVAAAFLLREKWSPSHAKTGPPLEQQEQQILTKSVLVLPFVNQTKDPRWNWTETGMMDMLIADLSQDPRLRVISADRLYQTLDDLKIDLHDNQRSSFQRLPDILSADWIVQGSLLQAGNEIRTDVRVTDRNNTDKSIYLTASGKKQEDLLQISGTLARNIEQRLHSGGPLLETQRETTSPTALKSFHEGADFLRQGEFDKAATFLKQAIAEDPKYARAYLKLSEAYDATDQAELSATTLAQGLKVANSNTQVRYLLLAQQASSEDDVAKAISLYQQYIQKFPNDSEVLFRLAGVYEDTGDLKNAVDTLEKLVKIDPNHPEAYFHLGKDTILTGEADKAISQYLLKALSIHTRLNNKRGEGDTLNAMGVGYERLGRYEDAIKYYHDSVSIKEQIGNKKGIAVSLSNIAKIYIFEGELPKAQEYLKKAQVIFQDLNDRKGIADSINQFGVIHEDQGSYTDALNDYKKALQIRKELGNDQLTAQSYDNIGHIYYLQGKYDDAEVFWKQALALRRSIGEESGVILSLQNMGFLQMAQGQLDPAVKSFMEALNQSRKIEYENAIAVSLGNLGNIHQMQGRYQAALDSYNQAIQMLEKLKDKKGIAEYTKLSGSAYLDLQMFSPAMDRLNAALKNAKESQSSEIVVDTNILLAQAERLQNHLREAQDLLARAVHDANAQHYDKAILQAKIESAWLLGANGKHIQATTLVEDLVDDTARRNDPWLKLTADYTLASLQLKAEHFQDSAAISEKALQQAGKLQANLYLFRFHSIASQAYRSLKNDAKAGEHSQAASSILAELTKPLSAEQADSLRKSPEASALQ